jgi:hypothetical protein
MKPSPQSMPVVSASPHVTAHSAPVEQPTKHEPSHLMLHADWSAHVIVLPVPTLSLHIDSSLQVALVCQPDLKSQFDDAAHVMMLPSPPAPLHCDVSEHVSVSGPSASPSHLAAPEHVSAQSSSHVVLQSVPAAQLHSESVQVQPVPVQTGAVLSRPHAANAIPRVTM